MLPLTEFLPDLSRFLRSAGNLSENYFQAMPRSIYILPTKYGVMFAVLVIAMLIGSINYANNLGFMLTFFLGAVGIVSIMHTWLNLLGLRFKVMQPQAVFCGENLQVDLQIENTSDKFRGAIQLSFKNGASFAIADVPANTSETLKLMLATQKRGLLSFPAVTVETRYPLGLFRAWMYFQPTISPLVYPRPIDTELPLSLSNEELGDLSNDETGGEDFHSHRSYRLTDSSRQVDWKVLARGRGLQTKVFSDAVSSSLWLSESTFPINNLEKMISLLCGAIIKAEAEKIYYGLQLDKNIIPPSNGSAHFHHCLKTLALYRL